MVFLMKEFLVQQKIGNVTAESTKESDTKVLFATNVELKSPKSRVRRERMGHITLASPVAHVWFFKGAPSQNFTSFGCCSQRN